MYVERGIKPRRIDPIRRIRLAFLARFCNWRDALVVIRPISPCEVNDSRSVATAGRLMYRHKRSSFPRSSASAATPARPLPPCPSHR